MNREDWSMTWLVARREFRERAQAKSFWVTSAILLLAVIAAAVIPAAIHGGSSGQTATVGITGDTSAAVTSAVREAGTLTDTSVSIVTLPTVAAAKAGLRSGQLDAVLVNGNQVLIKQARSVSGSGNDIADTLARIAGLRRLFAALPPSVVNRVSSGSVALPVTAIDPPPRGLAPRVTALILSIMTYVLIVIYGIRITIGVLEEKSSRVAEVLLTTLKPLQLLTGKVIGIGSLALAQIAVLGGVYLVTAEIDGAVSVRGASPSVIVMGVAWLLLGYAFYSCAFAAVGSMITRQADAQNAAFPLFIPLILGYVLTSTTVFANNVSPFFHLLTFIPFTAPVTMPALYAIGLAPWWQIAASALITIASTVFMVRLGGVIYGRAILRTGSRLKLREVLRAGYDG